jgi:hypothetical protein
MLMLFHGISLGTPTRSSSHSNQTPNLLATDATEYTFLKQMNDDYPDQPEAVWILVSSADKSTEPDPQSDWLAVCRWRRRSGRC